MKIFHKLLLSCLFVTIFISLVSGGVTYYIASKIILEKTIRQTEETVRKISENYDSYMQLTYNKLDYLAFNPTVQEELNSDSQKNESSFYSSGRKIKRLMVQMYNSKEMRDLEIYRNNGDVYFCALHSKPPELSNIDELQKVAYDNIGAITCINDLKSSGDMQILKEIKDTLSMESLGVLRVSIKTDALERIQENVDFASSGKIILLDENNEIILGDDSELTRKADDLIVNWDDSFQYKINGTKCQVVYRVSQETGWKTIGVIPSGEVTKSIMPLQIGTIVTILVGALLSIVLSIIMSYILERPIRNTVNALDQFSNGDFSVRLETDRKDEFGQMNQVFNITIKKIEDLLDEISYSRTLNKEMEFKALQSKINPHFLYNALDTVNWIAHKEHKDEICEMISAISSLLRISISNKESVFTVERELQYVKDYLYIQKARYRDRFEVFFDMAPEVLQQILPKLTLQPLVENCIVHSVEVSKEKTELTVTCRREGKFVIITVNDTGVGISKEKLKELNDAIHGNGYNIEDIQETHTGLGVYAVSRRLRYLYGEDSELSILSGEGDGTRVMIRFPFQENTETLIDKAEKSSKRRHCGTQSFDS